MNNLNARTAEAMDVVSTRVRAPSGRTSAIGARRAEKGSASGVFEELFRRMRESVVSAHGADGNSIKTRAADAPQPGGGKGAPSFAQVPSRAEVAQMAEGAREPGQIPTPNLTPGADSDIRGSADLPDPMRFLTAKPEPTNQNPGTARLQAVFGRNAVPMQESFSFSDAAAFVKAGAVTSSGEVFFLDALPGGARAGQMLDSAPDATAAMSVDNTFSALSRIMPEAPPAQGANRPMGIGSERLMEQIVQGVRMARQGEASEIVVRLKPDFLGRLTIRVLVDKHVIHVEIKVENEMVKQMLQDNLANLQHRLSEKGIAFDHLGVFAETGSQRDGEPAETAQQLDMLAIDAETEPEAAAAVLAEAAPLGRTGGIDYLA